MKFRELQVGNHFIFWGDMSWTVYYKTGRCTYQSKKYPSRTGVIQPGNWDGKVVDLSCCYDDSEVVEVVEVEHVTQGAE